MIFGKSDKFLNNLYHFADPAIMVTRTELNRIIKQTKFRYMRIWTTKLDGDGMRRMFQTRVPTGNPPSYNYQARGYWVMWSESDRGWRTIVLDNVEKVKLGNQFYKIKK
jgi:hypothetical protein